MLVHNAFLLSKLDLVKSIEVTWQIGSLHDKLFGRLCECERCDFSDWLDKGKVTGQVMANCGVISYSHNHLWFFLEGSKELKWNGFVEKVLPVWNWGFGTKNQVLPSDLII